MKKLAVSQLFCLLMYYIIAYLRITLLLIIRPIWYNSTVMERCPSGLRSWSWKPVTPQGAVGSNPTFSAVSTGILIEYRLLVSLFGEVPKRLKGLPWKGSRSLIAARGFKSLLLRLVFSKGELVDWVRTNIDSLIIKQSRKFLKRIFKNTNQSKTGRDNS